jgi:hypothetical protein
VPAEPESDNDTMTAAAETLPPTVSYLPANCYVTKPVDLDEFIGAVRQIEDFWLTIVKLPRVAA